MHVVTLISAPARAALSASVARDALDLAGGGTVEWLEPDVACDIHPENPLDAGRRAALAAFAAENALDCVVQEEAGRRKRILLADMDSTMIEQECIDELAAEIGLKDEVAAITRRAMNGEIAFAPALRERVALLKGLDVGIIQTVLESRITLAKGGRALVRTMRKAGARTVLVSGGFTAFTAPIAERIGFDENHANQLIAENGKLTGTVVEPVLGRDAKTETLHRIATELGVSVKEAMAVGDGANDLGMIEAAGSGVAIHAKPVVAAAAPHRVDHGDLTALLFMQGYRSDEFVR